MLKWAVQVWRALWPGRKVRQIGEARRRSDRTPAHRASIGIGRWESARLRISQRPMGERAAENFTTLWMWRQEYQHHEQLPLAFNGTWPSWNSDLDNRPW